RRAYWHRGKHSLADRARRPPIERRCAGDHVNEAARPVKAERVIAEALVWLARKRCHAWVSRRAEVARTNRKQDSAAICWSSCEERQRPWTRGVDWENGRNHYTVGRARGERALVGTHEDIVVRAVLVDVQVDIELIRRRVRPAVVCVHREDH